MAKQLNVNLAFTADTGKAKAQLQDLQNQLNKVINQPTAGLGEKMAAEIKEASYAAAELKVHLSQATNMQTGSLDFSKLNQSLKQSGVSLSEYAYKIRDIGPAGEQAFISLTKSIMSAEVPIKRSNAYLTEMWTTLKNTARWQISSSILHGFMGSIQSAYRYAQDLNESLNNIRIVTGHGVDDMTRFAEQANKAAKALSTTTTEYTNASLIYYQQGLNDTEVQKRTDITVKMANVARQSAEVVSDQMTAVWNNFYDGSKSLEYYADVMTALGAATASSTDEIAGGLEKFAAIGETIGLSYEYAASALATITSNTRQSEEVVGTALKTIFARIQGLNLGETLDDGTTLNKYSKALEKVGISIFDQQGELKEMDNILDEMASKWEALDKSQQTALAQTVAGVRQYTQLIALMENWDNGDNDSMTANLTTARTSEGALNQQHEIYAEGWEAASDRVRAALENIYNKLIDDDFFIGFLDSLTKVIDGVDYLIDRLGGLKGVLSTVGAIFTRIFSKQLTETFSNLAYNTKNFFDGGKSVRQEKANEIKKMLDDIKNNDELGSATSQTANSVLTAQLESQEYLLKNAKALSTTQQETLQRLIDQQKARGDQALQAAGQADQAKERFSDASANVVGYHEINGKTKVNGKTVSLTSIKTEAMAIGKEMANLNKYDTAAKEALEKRKKILSTEIDALAEKNKADKEATKALHEYGNAAIEVGRTEEVRKKMTEDASESILKNTQATNENSQAQKNASTSKDTDSTSTEKNTQKQQTNKNATDANTQSKKQATDKTKEHSAALDENSQKIEQNTDKFKLSASSFVSLGQSALSAVSAISMISSAIDTIKDPDTEPWDKFTSTIMSLGMAAPMLGNSLSSLSKMVVTTGGKTLGAAAASTKLGGAFAGLAGSAGGALSGIMALIPYIAIAAAAIAGLVVVIKLASDAYNADAIAAEKAAENAKAVAEANKEAAESYTKIQDAFGAYDTAKTALDECVQGTKEWDAALKDVNQTVYDLLETYPELASYKDLFVRDESGALVINSNVKDQVLADYEKRTQSLQMARLMSASDSSQAQLKSDYTDFERSIGSQTVGAGTAGNYNGYNSNGQKVGDTLNVGKFLTDNISTLSQAKDDDEFKELVKELLEEKYANDSHIADYSVLNQQNGQQITFKSQIDSIANSAVEYRSELNHLASSTEKVANELDNYSKIIVDENMNDIIDTHTTNDIDKEALAELNSELYQSTYKAIYDEIIEDDKAANHQWTEKDQSATQSEDGISIWERFKKAYGKDFIEAENQIQGDDKNRTYHYTNEEGKDDYFTIEFIASTIAASEALEQLTNGILNTSQSLQNIDTLFSGEGQEGLAEGFKNYLATGSFETLTEGQLVDLSEKQITADNLRSTFVGADGKQLSDEQIASIFESATIDEAVAKINGDIQNTLQGIANISSKLSETPKAFYEAWDRQGAFTNASGKARDEFAKLTQEVFNEFGTEGLENLSKVLGENGEYADEFAMILDDIDWNNISAEELAAKLEEAGVATDLETDSLGFLITAMRDAADATEGLTAAQQGYASLQEVGNLEIGDTISNEKMQELIDQNPIFVNYFDQMADGTWKLTKRVEDFQGLVDDLSFKPLYDRAEMLESQLGDLQNIGNTGYDKLSDTHTTGGIQQTQLDYISQYGDIDENTMAEWKNDLADGEFSTENAQAVANAIGKIGDQTENLEDQVISLKAETEAIYKQITFTDYVDRISEVGLEFETTEEYAQQLAKELDALDGEVDGVAEGYSDLLQSARNLAIANQRLDRGVVDLASSLDDYLKALTDSNKSTVEYVSTMKSFKTNLADIYNTSEDMISDQFAEELLGNPDDLKKIADGNMDVINQYRTKLVQSTIDDIVIGIDIDSLPEDKANTLLAQIDTLQSMIPNLHTEVALDGQSEIDFVNALNGMIEAAGMTRDEVTNLLGQMGVSATLKTTYKQQDVEVPIYKTFTTGFKETGESYHVDDGSDEGRTIEGYEYETATVQSGVATMPGYVPVTSIEMESADGKITGGGLDTIVGFEGSEAPKIQTSKGSQGRYSNPSGGGGGGSSTPQPAEKVDETKHSDIVDRYKEVDDALDDVADALEDVNKLTDRMYGKSHINGLKEQNRLLQEEIGLLHNKVAEAKAYLAVDRQNLANAAAQAGVSLNIDSSGNISNYTSEMNRLYNELAAAEQAWNASYQSKTQEDQQAYQENVLDPLNEKIDGLKEAIAQYDETRELIEDLENELDDKFYEWQDNNYEILHYTLEIEIELNDLELQEIEYYLDKISDDFYSMAEGLAYMNKQIPLWSDTLGDYETFYNGLNDAFAKGEISQAAYVEGLKESYSGIFDTLGALNELDDEMLHYYEDTLSAASDELATYTDHLEHLTSVLEHYKNIVELVNGEYDYDRIGTILEGQADTLNNELQVLKANYEMMLKEKQEIEQAYNNATAEEREVYEAELKAITAALDEAQDEMLSKTEEWAEAMKAIMENTIAAAGKELEDAFTGGIGFDSLANSLERLNSFNDEYLTKTNQIYETQKLMRQAQQASDRTDNQASKIKLKNFINETQQLQEKNKLSNLDLEIQQARYELLLAELALSEAQNAKATVRLQRDNEGNFGYVYTADLEAVTEREQALADAENALYNIGLNAANDYGQRRLELQQQLADELIALNERRNNGEFATDALYYAERDRIMAEYTDLFIAYSDQYTTALGVDAEIQQDAWIQAYDKMIDQTANWKDHTEEYLSNCEDAYSNWRDLVANESEQINDVLNGVEDNVKDVVDESKNLSNTLVHQVIPAINQELIAVRNVTSAYASQRAQIMQLIVYYEQLCASIRAAIAAQAAMDNAVASNNSTYEPGTVGGPGSSGNRPGGNGPDGNDVSQLATDAQELVRKVHNGEIAYDSYGWKNGAKDAGYSNDAIQIALNAFNDSKAGAGYDYYYDEALRLAGQYDTGGYTGAFGSAGRLAVLHEKELVLNKEDTENFLAATDILRGISKVIDLEAAQSTYAAARLVSGTIGEAKEILEQIVKIEASFPAVSDRNEIEAAFNNLINTASQYANRKR